MSRVSFFFWELGSELKFSVGFTVVRVWRVAYLRHFVNSERRIWCAARLQRSGFRICDLWPRTGAKILLQFQGIGFEVKG